MGLSLHDISTRTKIREVLLVAIERGDFERLPKGLLARGFIRAYAREVGLEPDSLVQEFVNELEPPLPVPDVTLPSRESLDTAQPRSLSFERRGTLGTVLAAIGVATCVAYVIDLPAALDRSMTAGAPAVEHGRIIKGTDVTLASVELDAYTPPALEVAGTAGPSLVVEIRPTRVVWVQALADGQRVLYELIHPDKPRLVEARREIVFRIGDAAAFQYTVNGVRGRQLGGPGEIRTINIRTDGYAALQDR